MTFGITNGSEDMLSTYLGSTSTGGLAAALSGSFQASPSFDLSDAADPFATSAYAGTGLSKARNLDAGALSYNQALNYAPPGGPMITKAQALAGLGALDISMLFNLTLLGLAGYVGYRKWGATGAATAALAAYGFKRFVNEAKP